MITKQIDNSSQITKIGYDKETKEFLVTYKGNPPKTYKYFDVAESLWEEAQTAESVGKFVAAKIKPHKYQFVA